jgi:hypothetical protein
MAATAQQHCEKLRSLNLIKGSRDHSVIYDRWFAAQPRQPSLGLLRLAVIFNKMAYCDFFGGFRAEG